MVGVGNQHSNADPSQEFLPAGNMTFKIPTGIKGKAATWTHQTRTAKSPGDGNPIKISILKGGIKIPQTVSIASGNRREESCTLDKTAWDILSVMESFQISPNFSQACARFRLVVRAVASGISSSTEPQKLHLAESLLCLLTRPILIKPVPRALKAQLSILCLSNTCISVLFLLAAPTAEEDAATAQPQQNPSSKVIPPHGFQL